VPVSTRTFPFSRATSRVARVLVSLQHSDEPAARTAREDPADPTDAVSEAPQGLREERRGETGVRVHDQDGVFVAELRQQ
jgi:hypothetical protein